MSPYARGNPARWWKSSSCGRAGRAPGALFVSPARRMLAGGALLGFGLMFGGMWYVTNPARISRLSETLLSRVVGGHVSVTHARLSWSGTLLLSGVEVRTADPEPTPGSELPVFSAEQIEARFDWLSLFSGQLKATQLVATTPVFRPIENRETGHWNYERLRPAVPATGKAPEKTGAPSGARTMPLPVVIIQDARVEWAEVKGDRVVPTGETVMDGRLVPDSASAATYRFQFTQRASAPAAGAADAGNGPGGAGGTLPGGGGELATAGGGGGGAAGEGAAKPADIGIELTGSWDVANDVLIASTENVALSEALKRGMPKAVREWCEQHQLTGRLASMRIGYSRPKGLTVSIEFDGVSMMFMIEPEQGIGMGEARPSYPLTVNNVRGAAVFSMEDGGMKINDLRGEALGYRFIADCTLKGTSFDAPLEMNIQFPGAVLGDRYPPLFMAFLTSQDLLQRIQPHGKVDIAIHLQRQAPRGPLLKNGRIQCHDVRIRFAHLPYPVDHLNGLITLAQDSVTFHNVTARADENRVALNGTVGTVWTNPKIDFRVTSDYFVFDDRLGATLPKKYAGIWEMFAVRGSGTFDCRVTRTGTLFEPPRVTVDVMVNEGRGHVKVMPYPFSNIKGRLRLEGDETRLEGMTATTGTDGSGKVVLNGSVHHPRGDVSNLVPELQISAEVPIEAALLQALPEEISKRLAMATLGGRVGFEGKVGRLAPPAESQPSLLPPVTAAAPELGVEGAFRWRGGTLEMMVGSIPVAAKEIEAEARVTAAGGKGGGAIDVRSFAGLVRVPGTEVEDHVKARAAGHLDLATLKTSLNIQADGEQLTLPRTAPGILPEAWRAAYARYSPAGKLDVHAALGLRVEPGEAAATGPGASSALSRPGAAPELGLDTYAVTIVPRGVTLKHPEWPEAAEALVGTIEVNPTVVEMTGMAAKVGMMDVMWSGTYEIPRERWALKGDVESRGLPVAWLERLPAGFAQRLNRKGDDQGISLRFADLTRESASKPWSFHATLGTRNLGITEPLRLSAGRTSFVSQGTYSPAAGKEPGALNFKGILAGTDVMVSEHPVETMTAHVEVRSADHSIRISAVDGKAAKGELQGYVNIYSETVPFAAAAVPATGQRPERSTQPPGGYEAQFMLKDADLAHLVFPAKATEEERRTMGTAKVNATLELREVFGPGGQRQGQGQLSLREGNLYNVPLAMGLMQMVTLRLPVARSFREGEILYHIEGDLIHFDRILLESPGINLAGAGNISFGTKTVSLSFITETPNEFSIPILSPIIQQTRNELLQISVTGTVENPKITPVPFSSISNALRALLPRPRAQEGR